MAGAWLGGAPRGVRRAWLGAPQRLQALPRALPQFFSGSRPGRLRSRARRNSRVAVGDATMLQSDPVRRLLRRRHGPSPTHARECGGPRTGNPQGHLRFEPHTHTHESDGDSMPCVTDPDRTRAKLGGPHTRMWPSPVPLVGTCGSSAIAGAWLGLSVGRGPRIRVCTRERSMGLTGEPHVIPDTWLVRAGECQ